jgi:hypothetical protein
MMGSSVRAFSRTAWPRSLSRSVSVSVLAGSHAVALLTLTSLSLSHKSGCWIEVFGHRVCETNGICFFFVWICVMGCYFYGSYAYGEAIKAEQAKERLIYLSDQKKRAEKVKK